MSSEGRHVIKGKGYADFLMDLALFVSFFKAFGGSADTTTVCFNGEATSFSSEDPTPIHGVCLENVANGSYVSMAAHDDFDCIFLTSQQGKIWSVNVAKKGSNGILRADETRPFIDIGDQVLFQGELGLLSMPFHPNFTQNGRFFVSFNCDKLQHSGFYGRCSCSTDVNCDPGSLGNDKGVMPCQYHIVLAEFSVNSTTSKSIPEESANPFEVGRILTMGLPFHTGHAGQILFGPADGYLRYVIGNGSNGDNTYGFAQNKKSLLGKILRFDVDKIPSVKEWNDKIICGETTPYQRIIHILTTKSYSLKYGLWVLGILGVVVLFRATLLFLMWGLWYLFTDVYAQTIWAGTEQPESSGNFISRKMLPSCAKDSPLHRSCYPLVSYKWWISLSRT